MTVAFSDVDITIVISVSNEKLYRDAVSAIVQELRRYEEDLAYMQFRVSLQGSVSPQADVRTIINYLQTAIYPGPTQNATSNLLTAVASYLSSTSMLPCFF